jgi:hypothetical protein
MQPTAKDTKKDAEQPAPPATDSKSTGDRAEHDRMKRTADEMSRRGMKRQHKGEVGKTFPK